MMIGVLGFDPVTFDFTYHAAICGILTMLKGCLLLYGIKKVLLQGAMVIDTLTGYVSGKQDMCDGPHFVVGFVLAVVQSSGYICGSIYPNDHPILHRFNVHNGLLRLLSVVFWVFLVHTVLLVSILPVLGGTGSCKIRVL